MNFHYINVFIVLCISGCDMSMQSTIVGIQCPVCGRWTDVTMYPQSQPEIQIHVRSRHTTKGRFTHNAIILGFTAILDYKDIELICLFKQALFRCWKWHFVGFFFFFVIWLHMYHLSSFHSIKQIKFILCIGTYRPGDILLSKLVLHSVIGCAFSQLTYHDWVSLWLLTCHHMMTRHIVRWLGKVNSKVTGPFIICLQTGKCLGVAINHMYCV